MPEEQKNLTKRLPPAKSSAKPAAGMTVEPPVEQISHFESLNEYTPTNPGIPSTSESSPGSLLEEPKIEKIENFESLDDYSPTNPGTPSEPSAAAGAGAMMEEPPIEKIEDFENLDDYVPTNPELSAPPAEEVVAESPGPNDISLEAPDFDPDFPPSEVGDPALEGGANEGGASSDESFQNDFAETPAADPMAAQSDDHGDFPVSAESEEAPSNEFLETPAPEGEPLSSLSLDSAPAADAEFPVELDSNSRESAAADFPASSAGETSSGLPSFEFDENEKSMELVLGDGPSAADALSSNPETGAETFAAAPELDLPAVAAESKAAPESTPPNAKGEPAPSSELNSTVAKSGSAPSLELNPTTIKADPISTPAVAKSASEVIPLPVAAKPPSLSTNTPPGPPKSAALEKVKKAAEAPAISTPPVPAAFPFSLLIEGHLLPHEQSKLLDILSRQNMGIREIDLEPQFAHGRVLIPRISEYAGIILIQALRGTAAHLRFGPADTIFASSESKSNPTPPTSGENENQNTYQFNSSFVHPAEIIPIFNNDEPETLPTTYTVIDTVMASELIQSREMEATHSRKFQELLEGLQRELRYKAHHKGATCIIHFKVQVISLSSPQRYRLLVMGTAAK